MSDNLEDMKRMAMEAMKNKKALKSMAKDMSGLEDTSMFVFQKEEVALLEALLFDVLEKNESAPEVYKNEKRTAYNMLKHMEAI